MGVILGSGGGAPDFLEEQFRLYYSERLRKLSAYNISSSTIGSLSSEISIYFGFHGASHVISTGCTSSTDALGYAFNMIRFGLADHMVTGGTDHNSGGDAGFLRDASRDDVAQRRACQGIEGL